MTKKSIFKIAGMFILAITLVSCNGLKKMAKNYNSVSYEVNPKVLETKGGEVEFTINGTIPPKFFNKKAAVLFQPVLKWDGGELELAPLMLIGENVEGQGTRINYANGGTMTYSETFDYVPEMKASELMVNSIAFLPKDAVAQGMTMADAMKMPKALNLGEVKLADGVIFTSERIRVKNEVTGLSETGMQSNTRDAVDLLEIAPHGYEKVTLVSEQAMVYYPKNLHYFKKDLKFNKEMDVMGQLENLNDFVRKGWEIKDIQINGWASPEGEETFNEGLSERRANTANDIIYNHFKKLVKESGSVVSFENPKEDINLKKVGHGPDWNGFLDAVEKSDIRDKRPILNVVKSSSPDKREEEIRNMINIYPELEESILPSLRRAHIMVNCFEPKKTDDEIARLATTNPSKLDEKELLYAATLTDNLNTQYTIYKSATENFPTSWKGFNNAAYAALKLGKTDEAVEYLTKAKDLNRNNGAITNNLGVAQAINGDFAEAEKSFLEANKMGVDNNYNLGIIDIKNGKYQAAISKFAGVKCNYHVALANLMTGNNSVAKEHLGCATKNGDTYYLMAVVAARTNDDAAVMANLKKAIAADAKFKKCAEVDREFLKYFENADYQAMIK
jgi:tetratricopeptide (TPR) repeat protein